MQKLLLACTVLLLSACGANPQPTAARANPTVTSVVTSAVLTTVTETTTVAPTSTTETFTTPITTKLEKRVPVLSSSSELWVEDMAIFMFADLAKKRGDLARGASSSRARELRCGSAVIDGTSPTASPAVVWCGKLAKKFYFSEPTINTLQKRSEQAAQVAILQAIAAYSLNESSMPGDFSQEKLATEVGRLLSRMVCNQGLDRAQAERLTPYFDNQATAYRTALKNCI